MKKIWNWINTHKWAILVALTALAALSLIFVDTDGIADKQEVYEVVE